VHCRSRRRLGDFVALVECGGDVVEELHRLSTDGGGVGDTEPNAAGGAVTPRLCRRDPAKRGLRPPGNRQFRAFRLFDAPAGADYPQICGPTGDFRTLWRLGMHQPCTIQREYDRRPLVGGHRKWGARGCRGPNSGRVPPNASAAQDPAGRRFPRWAAPVTTPSGRGRTRP
jgi:hypothetical protein